MTRDFFPLKTAIWADDEFRALRPQQQHAYFLIGSQGPITACGVFPLPVRRLTKMAAGLTTDYLQAQVDLLAQARFMVVDWDTDELLIRSYMRHDGLLKMGDRPAKRIARDFPLIESGRISDAVLDELRRLFQESPKFPGWKGIRSESPDLADMIEKPA